MSVDGQGLSLVAFGLKGWQLPKSPLWRQMLIQKQGLRVCLAHGLFWSLWSRWLMGGWYAPSTVLILAGFTKESDFCFPAVSLNKLYFRMTLNIYFCVFTYWIFVGRSANGADGGDPFEVVVLWRGNTTPPPLYFWLGLCIIVLVGLKDLGIVALVIPELLGMARMTALCIWPVARLELNRPILNQPGDTGSEDSQLLSSDFVT